MILYVILISLFTLALIIEDIRWFEINYGALGIVAVNGTLLNVSYGLSVLDLAFGAFSTIFAAVFVRGVFGRKAIGQGDIWLYGTVGLVASAGGMVITIVTKGILMVVTAVSYEKARPRAKPRRQMFFPAALPTGITILLIFCCRVGGLDISFGLSEQLVLAIDISLRAWVEDYGVFLSIASLVAGIAWHSFDLHSMRSEHST